MTGSDAEILNLIRDTIWAIAPTAEILLYGSRARNNARSDSDWDILVLLDVENLTQSHKDIDYLLWQKGLDLGQEINTTVRTKEQWQRNVSLFKHNVVKDAIRL